jgi:hypothetical protein
MTLARLAAAAAVAVLVAGVALALGAEAPRLAGTNDLRAFHSVPIPARDALCQGPEIVPGDSARLRVFASGTGGSGPPLAVEIRDGSGTVSRGRIAPGYGDGGVTAEIELVGRTRVVDEVCVENRGEKVVALVGQPVPADQLPEVGGAPAEARLRLEWLRPGSESWLDLAPAVLHRYGLGKADALGSWTLWLAAALVLLAGFAALRLVLRGGRA